MSTSSSDIPVNFTNCPYWGVGGSYIADPVTGMRTRVDPAPIAQAEQPAAPAELNDSTAGQAGQADKPAKEKKNG